MEKEIDLASTLFNNDGDNNNKKSSRSKRRADFKDGGEGVTVSPEHTSAFLPSKKRLRKQVGTVVTSLPTEPSLKVTIKKSSGPLTSEGGKKKGIVVAESATTTRRREELGSGPSPRVTTESLPTRILSPPVPEEAEDYQSSDGPASALDYSSSSGDNGSASATHSESDSGLHNDPLLSDALNVHAEDTDGYDSDLTRNQAPHVQSQSKIDFTKIRFFDGKGEHAPDLDPDLANILTVNWWELDKSVKGNKDHLDDLFKKFKSPGNCPFDPPVINKVIKELLDDYQKKGDFKFECVQMSLAKSMNAVIQLYQLGQEATPDLQQMTQLVSDIAAILGDASQEISQKRRAFVRSSLADNYKSLCNNKGSRAFLFGDDLTKDITDLNLTNKLQKVKQGPPARKNNRVSDFRRGKMNQPKQRSNEDDYERSDTKKSNPKRKRRSNRGKSKK